MNKKFIAAFIAVFLLLSCAASAFAVSGVGIGDIIGVISSIDASEYTKYNEQEWTTLTPAERAEQLNYVINHQKGTSHLNESSDLINDSAASFQAYDILTGNSSVGGALLGGDASSNMIMKIGLEQKGYADFGMGYYNSNGHSSGKFGDGTVADTLNDEFLDYVKDNPFKSDFINLVKGSDSRYISWKLVVNTDYVANTYRGYNLCPYGFNLYLHNSEGTIIDYYVYCWGMPDTPLNSSTGSVGMFYNGYSTPKLSLTYDINNNTITSVGMLYYTYSFNTTEKRTVIKCPWDLSEPAECDNDDTIVAVGTDDNGNQIQFNINSDGVTYEGSTYNYNDDNSVTINGNTYYITVNPDNVDDDYYNKFLQQVINNYYNYYNTDSTPFDGTDILSALKSIFTSLETFRSYCYSQFKQLTDYVFDGFNSMRSLISSWGKKIVDAINALGGVSNLSDEALANYQKKLEDAVKLRFLPVIELRDLVDKALNAYRDNSTSQISFDYKGRSYSIDFADWFTSENLQSLRFLMAAFIYVTYAFNTFRRIPSYINNGGDK